MSGLYLGKDFGTEFIVHVGVLGRECEDFGFEGLVLCFGWVMARDAGFWGSGRQRVI